MRRAALNSEAIGRMISIIEHEQGYPLYEAVGRTKRALSNIEVAPFHFDGGGLQLETEISRDLFEEWISEDVAAIEQTVDRALAAASAASSAIDRVFLTGGTSLVPRIRRIFVDRFGEDRIETGGELTSIAHGLALIGLEDDLAAWAA